MYQGIAFRTAYVLTGSAEDAEDAAQTGFVKAWRALPRFRPRLTVQALAPAHRGQRGAQPAAIGRPGALTRVARDRGRALGRRGPVSRGSRARARAAGGVARSGAAPGRARSRRVDLPVPARALGGGDRHGPRSPARHRQVPNRTGARASADGGGAVSELERALTAIGRELDVPEAPDLVPAVLAQLGSRSGWRPERRRWILAVALVVVAASRGDARDPGCALRALAVPLDRGRAHRARGHAAGGDGPGRSRADAR